jgi:hypothetical protein
MTDEEKRAILATARANANGPRYHVPESAKIERRMQEREQQAAECASATAIEQVRAECERAYFAWIDEGDTEVASEGEAPATPVEPAQTLSWADWVDKRLEEERGFIMDAVGEALGEFVEQARVQMRGELLTEMNRLRAEAARERADDLKQLKTQNANLSATLQKMRQEVSSKQIDLPARAPATTH